MSDKPETPPAGAPGADGGTQPRPTVPPLQITAQYIKDLSFENPHAAQILTQRSIQPQITVNVDVRTTPLGGNTYEVVLHLRGDAKSGDLQAFLIELDYGGIVTIGPEVPKQQAALLLSIEAPRMLFPYARAVVSEATREGGFPPLYVQPIDFVALFQRQVQALRERIQAGEGEVGTVPLN